MSDGSALVREIMHNIRAELVCCDAYELYAGDAAAIEKVERAGHGICFWGEAAARIAWRTYRLARKDSELGADSLDAVAPHVGHDPLHRVESLTRVE